MDRDILLEALGAVCNVNITSIQKQRSAAAVNASHSAAPTLFIKQLISTVADGDQTCPVSRSNLFSIRRVLHDGDLSAGAAVFNPVLKCAGPNECLTIDEDEFFDRRFDYDFTKLKDTDKFYRGGEPYQRPCGWQRFALKVLDKYDDNTWLGTQNRSTQSVPGEWPVSYHGTSEKGAEGIIEGFYKPGDRQRFGRGIYSTPDIEVATSYAKKFTCKKNGKSYKVLLQNRINPKHRKKYNNDKYWVVLIPPRSSDAEEQELSERAIRPYGLLLKEV